MGQGPTAGVLLMAKGERLFEQLRNGLGYGLTLVACPAGFGKTTLLAAWREADARRPAAWLDRVDRGQHTPVDVVPGRSAVDRGSRALRLYRRLNGPSAKLVWRRTSACGAGAALAREADVIVGRGR